MESSDETSYPYELEMTMNLMPHNFDHMSQLETYAFPSQTQQDNVIAFSTQTGSMEYLSQQRYLSISPASSSPGSSTPEEIPSPTGDDSQSIVIGPNVGNIIQDVMCPDYDPMMQYQFMPPTTPAGSYATPPPLFMSPTNAPESGPFDALDDHMGHKCSSLITPLISPDNTPIYPTVPQPPIAASSEDIRVSPLSSPVLLPQTGGHHQFTPKPPKSTKTRQRSMRTNQNGTAPSVRRRSSTGPTITSAVSTTLNATTYQQQQVQTPQAMMAMHNDNNGRVTAASATNAIHQLSPSALVKSQPSPPGLSVSNSVPPAYPAPINIPASIAISPAMPPPPAPSPTAITNPASTTAMFAPVTPGSLMKLPSTKSSKSASKQPVPVLPILNGFPIAPPPSVIPTMPIPSPSLESTQMSPKTGQMLIQAAAERLANKSNYQILADGETAQVGITYKTDIHSGIELRRTSHKAAEQKRRDSLKRCFDDLLCVIPEVTERNPSKVFLLKRTYDCIIQLKTQSQNKDKRIQSLKAQIREMRELLGLPLVPDNDDDEMEKGDEALKRIREEEDEDDSDDEASVENESEHQRRKTRRGNTHESR